MTWLVLGLRFASTATSGKKIIAKTDLELKTLLSYQYLMTTQQWQSLAFSSSTVLSYSLTLRTQCFTIHVQTVG